MQSRMQIISLQQVQPVYQKTATTMMLIPVEGYIQDVTEIKMMLRMLLEQRDTKIEKSDLVDINEASTLLNISTSTIYKMTAKKEIPFFKREGSKKLIFSRSCLELWVKESHTTPVNLVEEYLHKNQRVRK